MKFFSFIFLIFISVQFSFAQHVEFQGQFLGWSLCNARNAQNSEFCLRFFPKLNFSQQLNKNVALQSNLTLDGRFNQNFSDELNLEQNSHFQIYRLWLRLQSQQMELRIGRQKINFGQARYLRSLMWFDKIDPRDPLQLTPGVDALLFRYFWLNNANLWFWSVYDEGKQLGLDRFKGQKDSWQFGGRFQYPLPFAEMAVTFHQKKIVYQAHHHGFERRLALDGFWDVGPGLWFEYALSKSSVPDSLLSIAHYLTLGSDYTFGFGNGLHCSLELLSISLNKRFFTRVEQLTFVAFELDYPLTLLDQLLLLSLYSDQGQTFVHYLNWQRAYDNWLIYLSLFYSTKSMSFYDNQAIPLVDRGLRLMVVFNF